MQGSDSYLETLSTAPGRARWTGLIVAIGLLSAGLLIAGQRDPIMDDAPMVAEAVAVEADRETALQIQRCLRAVRASAERNGNQTADETWHYDAIIGSRSSDLHIVLFKGDTRARCYKSEAVGYVAFVEPFMLRTDPLEFSVEVLGWGHPGYLTGRAHPSVTSITLELVDGRRLPVPLGEHGWFARDHDDDLEAASAELMGSERDIVELQTTDGTVIRRRVGLVLHPHWQSEHYVCAEKVGCVEDQIDRLISETRDLAETNPEAEALLAIVADRKVTATEFREADEAERSCAAQALDQADEDSRELFETRTPGPHLDHGANSRISDQFDADWRGCATTYSSAARDVRRYRLAELDVAEDRAAGSTD